MKLLHAVNQTWSKTRSNSGNIMFYLLTAQPKRPPSLPLFLFVFSHRTCAAAISQKTSLNYEYAQTNLSLAMRERKKARNGLFWNVNLSHLDLSRSCV